MKMTFCWNLRGLVGLALALSVLLIAQPVRAQVVVDLSEHTNLKGAFLIQQPRAENARVDLFFDVGESDNTGPEGMSHYVEHLVAWSADRANGDNIHARSMNAWASVFFTNYHNAGPHARLPQMLNFAARVFQPIELQQSFMRSERNIVEREFDLRYSESASNQLYLAAMKALYPGHARGRATIGSRDSIQQIIVKDALAFHQQNYSADRATLLISGNLNVNDVIGQLKAAFSDLPVIPHSQRPLTQPLPAPQSTPVILQTATTTQPSVLSVFHGLPLARTATGLDLAAYDLLAAVLASSLPGGLQKPLYFDDFWVETVNSWIEFQPQLHPQLFVWAEPDIDVAPPALLTQIDATLRQLAQNGIPTESFEIVRADVITTRKRLMMGIDEQRQYAHLTARNLAAPLPFRGSIQLLEEVTLDQVNAALRRLVDSPQHVTAIAYPKE